ncbi:MAG: hypothetical protein IT334_04920 [Thermomicrobiales bacterium]|nr:hypothetical protein [Thermomicrobiales bacterium]
MSNPKSPDHETELLQRFAADRAMIVRLAHQQEPALTSASLLERMRQDEALERLRTHWQAGADPFDLGNLPATPVD